MAQARRWGFVAAGMILAVATIATTSGGAASADDTTTTSSTTTPTTVPETTTTGVPDLGLVAELPSFGATAGTEPTPSTLAPPVDRGTQWQATPTLPPPPTTTTIPFDPTKLPDNSGTGRRIVYSKSLQRVWTVEADGRVSNTHAVSGRLTWDQPLPGTYSVFSRSMYTCNIDHPYICWRYMVRFAKGGDGDNIGFHEIPTNNNTGQPLQTLAQLGQPLSGGCVRQATPDAQYIWDWAPIGTKVVVLA